MTQSQLLFAGEKLLRAPTGMLRNGARQSLLEKRAVIQPLNPGTSVDHIGSTKV